MFDIIYTLLQRREGSVKKGGNEAVQAPRESVLLPSRLFPFQHTYLSVQTHVSDKRSSNPFLLL